MQRDDLLNLFKDCDFEGRISSDNFEDKILINLPEDFNYKYFYGASKLCIIPTDSKFVIKIPFNSEWFNYDEIYEDFLNANQDDRYNWDYCFTEILKYNAAKKEKINKMFCKTKILGYVNDYPIYIQERATVFCNLKGKNNTDERAQDIKKYCRSKNFSCFNPVWIADAIDYYGQKQFDKMMTFIKNNCIGDLHDGNIGYIGRKPVLIDYSDFFE